MIEKKEGKKERVNMDFQTKLRNYADLLVTHGLNIQEGQMLNLTAEICHQELAYLVAEAAYERGAKFVQVDFIDPRLERLRIQKSSEENLQFVPQWISAKYNELVDDKAANMRILGSEFPDILSDLDPQAVNNMRMAQRGAIKYFYEVGIGRSKVHWTLGAAATPAWAKKLFPLLDEDEACARLWDEIFHICRVDREDYLEAWREHNDHLHQRCAVLDKLKIECLHFTGPDTDLKVYLSEHAKFKGGGDQGPFGVEFEPNIPTEECFTTPNRKRTEGKVKTTRPFFINGVLIEDLVLEFKEGKISNFTASSGSETFSAYINSDEGASYLGEVALVGIDSPVYQSGHVFQEILYDENAACHIAVGMAYKFCIRDQEKMSAEDFIHIGCNESKVHTDMMISSEKVDVVAHSFSGEEHLLIKNGEWQI
ncbi:MAG: aminopeptidase [Waddliaceae bacterium]|nr:aminopeptidase [Waddliaceae bacterium]